MKQSLNLNLSQQLKLSPQIKQSLLLLQLSATDLQLEVEQALQDNPLLEQESVQHNDSGDTENAIDHDQLDAQFDASTTPSSLLETSQTEPSIQGGDLPTDIEHDSWDDSHPQPTSFGNTLNHQANSDSDLFNTTANSEGLFEHLSW